MELVWSKSRVRRFLRCRREYFIYHYATAGGFEPDADSETSELWFYKTLLPAHYYIHRLVRKMLYRAIILKRSVAECCDDIIKQWSMDMAEERVHFYEQVYSSMTFSEIRDMASEEITRVCQTLGKSELREWMNRTKWRPVFIGQPLEFMLGDIIIYTAPFAMLCSGKEYIMLELKSERMLDSAALHRYYAFQFHHIRPAVLRSCFYDLSSGEIWSPEFDSINFSDSAARICEEAEMLATAIPDEIIANRAYFAVAGAPRTSCSTCNFAKVCRQY